MSKRFFKGLLLNTALATPLLFFPNTVQYAKADLIEYALFGKSTALIDRSNNGYASKNRQAYFELDWSGAFLTHQTGGTTDYADDSISINGQVSAKVCFVGEACSGKFRKKDHNSLYIGEGTFEFIDVEFSLDAQQTVADDELYAGADQDIGKLRLISQKLPLRFKPNQKIKGDLHDIDLGLKLNPDLGYAFRLFDEDPQGDNLYRIASWIMTSSYLFAGSVRLESLPIEDVFNGDIFACRINAQGNCDEAPGPSQEVPEPASILLLGIGAAGLAKYRKVTD